MAIKFIPNFYTFLSSSLAMRRLCQHVSQWCDALLMRRIFCLNMSMMRTAATLDGACLGMMSVR